MNWDSFVEPRLVELLDVVLDSGRDPDPASPDPADLAPQALMRIPVEAREGYLSDALRALLRQRADDRPLRWD